MKCLLCAGAGVAALAGAAAVLLAWPGTWRLLGFSF